MFPASLLVVAYCAQIRRRAVAVVHLQKRLVIPFHDHPSCAALVAFLYQHLDKLRLIQLRCNEYLLPLLNIAAYFRDKTCVTA